MNKNKINPSTTSQGVYKKVETIIQTARHRGVSIKEMVLSGKEYELFAKHPVVSQVIGILALTRFNSKTRIMWDGVHILNNKCSKKKSKEKCNHEVFFASSAQRKHLSVRCLGCDKEMDLFQLVSKLQERVKALEQ